MKILGWILLIVGAGGVALGFKLQADANEAHYVNELTVSMGGYARDTGTAAPLVAGIGGAVLALVGLVLLVVAHAMMRSAPEA